MTIFLCWLTAVAFVVGTYVLIGLAPIRRDDTPSPRMWFGMVAIHAVTILGLATLAAWSWWVA